MTSPIMGDSMFRAMLSTSALMHRKSDGGTSSADQQSHGHDDMSTVVIPMHKSSEETVRLIQILGTLPENTWAWSMLELWGTGIAPQGMTMQSFEDYVSSSDAGYQLGWRELVSTASSLDQVHDCLIAATRSPFALTRPSLDQASNPELLVVIEALDSTEWGIRIGDHLDDAREIKERLASLR
ncbi:hypothetical protein ACGFNP_55280 [Nonomuraea sp. NPDC049269]|uniref:hypothetical protein n=1 Tax=Nonomuraea sp. NPDC049269 TaxID=3364349 RepID=UPI0037161805